MKRILFITVIFLSLGIVCYASKPIPAKHSPIVHMGNFQETATGKYIGMKSGTKEKRQMNVTISSVGTGGSHQALVIIQCSKVPILFMTETFSM